MIKNIVFDMGNVLLDYNPEVPLNKFCTSEEEKNVIREELFHGPEWAMADRGEIKDEERYDLVKLHVPKKHWTALQLCCEHWTICMKELKGAKEFCNYVKEKGYQLFILSNASNSFYYYFEDFLPFDFFDGIVVSADIRIVKPDPRIYEYLLNHYHLKPEECFFIDDRMDNVEGGRSAGMNVYQFQNDYEAVRKELEHYQERKC